MKISTEDTRTLAALRETLAALLHLHETPGDFTPEEASDVLREAHNAVCEPDEQSE